MNEITVGQKLYHFAYGPLTVIQVGNDTVTTVADDPAGFRQAMDYNIGVYSQPPQYRSVKGIPEEELRKDSTFEGYRKHNMSAQQTWMTIVIGHWLFKSPDEVGTENNDFDFLTISPNAGPEGPYDPAIGPAKEIDYYHQWYFDNGYLDADGKMRNGVQLISPTGHDAYGMIGTEPSSGIKKKNKEDGSSGIAKKGSKSDSSSGVTKKE